MNCSWPLAILSTSVLPPLSVSAGRTTCTTSFRVSRMFATTACTPYLLIDFSACSNAGTLVSIPHLCYVCKDARRLLTHLIVAVPFPRYHPGVRHLWQGLHIGGHHLKAWKGTFVMRSPLSVSSLKLTMKASGAHARLSTPSILGTCTPTGHLEHPSASSGPNLLSLLSGYKQHCGGAGS